MKKLLALTLALVMALALTVPALAAEEEKEETVLSYGLLTYLDMDEEDFQDQINDSWEQNPIINNSTNSVIFNCNYYDSLTEMLMALEAGFIDRVMIDEPTVQYVLSQNDAYVEAHPETDFSLEYSMLFLEEDTALCDQFSEAIQAMQDDGTLDELAATYIDGVIAGEEPEAVAFPSFDGADTVTVAVTGDLPPMDYVDDAGQARGFNTAVLAEIAQRLEINIEFIQVDAGARALALASGRADAAFWVQSPAGSDALQINVDVPENTVASEPYYAAHVCTLVLKDAK